MSKRRGPLGGRISGVSILAAAVVVLLPALAWLQYSWLDQIAAADRERRERTLQTAASQLAQDFESELAKTVSGLQIDSTTVDQQNWADYAARYQAWADSATAPEIVKAIYFVEGGDDGPKPAPPELRLWNAQARTFDRVEWPEELQNIKLRFTQNDRRFDFQAPGPPRGGRGGERGGDRMILPPSPLGDEQSIVVPVMRITPAARPDPNAPPAPPDVRLLGFTIVRLNLNALAQEVLPILVRRHLFDDQGHSDYLVAVVSRARLASRS